MPKKPQPGFGENAFVEGYVMDDMHRTVVSVYDALPLSIEGIATCGTLTSEPEKRGGLVSYEPLEVQALLARAVVHFYLARHQWNMRAHWSVLRMV